MSEGLANQATQLHTVSQDLSLQVATLNASLAATQAIVNQAREETRISSELRNETENSVMMILSQVSQLQIASSMSYCARGKLNDTHVNFRYCTESSKHYAGLC